MSKYCKDCGTKLRDGICPNCQEELYIFENQIINDNYYDSEADGMLEVKLSNEFMQKMRKQREQVDENKNR